MIVEFLMMNVLLSGDLIFMKLSGNMYGVVDEKRRDWLVGWMFLWSQGAPQ